MAVVAIPGARSTRPLDFATPNWGSDKLRGIQRLVLFDSPTPQDLIRGTQLTRVGSAITKAATPAGFAGMANTAETSYWTLPSFSSDNTRSLSMLWVGLHSGGTTPITIRDNSSSAGNILFWRNAGQWDQRVGGTDYTAAGTFTTNRLYSAVVSCSATAAKTFVDGVLVINGAAPASTGVTSPWYINQNGPNSQGPLATTVLLAIWDRSLSDQEASALSLDPWQLFAEHIIVISRAAGGTSWSVSLTESVTPTDAAGAVLIAAASLSESVTAADAQSTAGTQAGAVTETVIAADSVSALAVLSAVLSEPVTATDLLAAAHIAQAAVAEAIAASDSQTTGPVVSAALTESATASEALSAAALLVAQIAEAAVAGDTVATSAVRAAALVEAVTASDTVASSAPAAYSVSLAELVTAVDAIASAIAGSVSGDPDTTFIVPSDNRALVVPADSRTFTVQ